MAPKDIESASALANVLKPYGISIGVYNSGAAEKLLDAGLGNIISTAPLVINYAEVIFFILRFLFPIFYLKDSFLGINSFNFNDKFKLSYNY